MTSEKELIEFIASGEAVEIGKVVWLKSGGQAMTVRSISRGKALCEWFDKSRLRQHDFVLHSLTGRKPKMDGEPAGLIIIGDLQSETSEQ